MQVKVKRLCKEAQMPYRKHNTDAGFDLTATSIETDEYGNIVYHTGLAFEIPNGYAGFLFMRSSNCKKNILLMNGVGVIDSSYRGEVTFKFRPITGHQQIPEDELCIYKPGERIGQLIIMPIPYVHFDEVEELSESERGDGGYGSTGK